MAKWLLIDGFNLAYRCFHAIPGLARADGFPTNAIHGWVRTIWGLEDKERPEYVVTFFDLGGSQDRLAMHPAYKAHRSEMPLALREQFPWLKKITTALGIPIIERAGTEADDLIASAAVKLYNEGHEVYIVSADKDFGQLLSPGIFQLLPPAPGNSKSGWGVLDEESLYNKLSVKANQVVDYLALIGDIADNIPGVPGVGPKIAARWIQEYGTLENLLSKVNYIQPARFQLILPNIKEALLTNVKMIRLNTGLEVDGIYGGQLDIDTFMGILEVMEMKSVIKDAKKRLGIAQELA